MLFRGDPSVVTSRGITGWSAHAARQRSPPQAPRPLDGDLRRRDRRLPRARPRPRDRRGLLLRLRRARSTPSRSPYQVPNLIRALVADAALSSAFVPVFTELLEKGDRKRAWRVASSVFFLMLLGLGGPDGALHRVRAARDRAVRRPGRRRAARDHAHADPLPDRRAARRLRRDRRDPEQLRRVHGAGARPGRLEHRDHRRARDRRAAARLARHEALRLRRSRS